MLFRSAYRQQYPDDAARWEAWHTTGVPPGLNEDPRMWQIDKPMATRAASGQIMQLLTEYLPNLMGGSADLNASTKTYLKGRGDFQAGHYQGNNIYFGVREHAMAAILSGLALHGGLRPFGSTFFSFLDYMKPAVRLTALMGLPVVYVFTHDSIAVGEDGPTHQPIEQLANLRSIPNMHVFRPADGRETASAWLHALGRADGPTALILTRQNLPPLVESGPKALQGGYILVRESGDQPDLILLGSGSEVSLLTIASEQLTQKGIAVRVVSLPCQELFLAQSESYRETVLPQAVQVRLAVEAAWPAGWERFVGPQGGVLGLERFGASAPGEVLMEKFGFTVDKVVGRALQLLGVAPD